jgi:hypothetical protein
VSVRIASAMDLKIILLIFGYALVVASPVWIPIVIYLRAHKNNQNVKVMTIEELMAAGYGKGGDRRAAAAAQRS